MVSVLATEGALVSRSEIFTVQQLCNRAGIPRSTLRVYEREGLIEPDARTASGYRLFSEAALERLRAIRAAKDLGFSLAEILDLLKLSDAGQLSADEVRQVATERLGVIEERLQKLAVLRDELQALRDAPDKAFESAQSFQAKLVQLGANRG